MSTMSLGRFQELLSLFTIYIFLIGFICTAAIAHYQITENAEAIDTIRETTSDDHDRIERIDAKTQTIERDVSFIRERLLREWGNK
tara:strand:+ start:86 stop:343 length:258 start_codon:yes stop_codon:yes gene_type:complete